MPSDKDRTQGNTQKFLEDACRPVLDPVALELRRERRDDAKFESQMAINKQIVAINKETIQLNKQILEANEQYLEVLKKFTEAVLELSEVLRAK